ncbi:MAG: hypothetical protein ACI4EA_04610 [Candidatus Ornithomonoglobus sp.]
MNYMNQIANLLGVEPGERFDIKDGDSIKKDYYFDESGLRRKDDCRTPCTMNKLLNGMSEIVKHPLMDKATQIDYKAAWENLKEILKDSLEIAEMIKPRSTTEYEFIVSQLRIDFNTEILKKMQTVESELAKGAEDEGNRS